jgi:F420-non-reducing hydrogenase iron-sulfur subunit
MRRFQLVQKYIKQMGIDPERLRLEWVSASEGKIFAEIVDDMTAKLMKLGPCNIKKVTETLS